MSHLKMIKHIKHELLKLMFYYEVLISDNLQIECIDMSIAEYNLECKKVLENIILLETNLKLIQHLILGTLKIKQNEPLIHKLLLDYDRIRKSINQNINFKHREFNIWLQNNN